MNSGWSEERFCAQFQAVRLALPHETVVGDLMAAFRLRLSRAEPLHELAVHCRLARHWGEAFAIADLGAMLPRPDDKLFVMHEVYDWKLLDELCVAACRAGFFERARDAARTILYRLGTQGVQVPDADVRRIRENLRLAKARLG